MFRLAIISDLHADFPALEAALNRIKSMGCDGVVCAGDVVDGDSFPDEVIGRLIAEGIPTIRGNHDRWASEREGSVERKSPQRGREDLRRDGQPLLYEDDSAIFGSGMDLSADSMRFLKGLPTSMTLEYAGVRVVVWHASVKSDMAGIYPGQDPIARVQSQLRLAEADVLLVGHTHEPFAVSAPGGGLVANPGALYTGGMSFARTGALHVPDHGTAPGGTFGVLELPTRRFSVYRAADGALVMEST